MQVKILFRWRWPECNPTNEKKQNNVIKKKKNSIQENSVCAIGYVEAKKIGIYCQKRVQSHAAQEGSKYRGQWRMDQRFAASVNDSVSL